MEVLLLAAAIAADEEEEVDDDAVSAVLSVCMVNDAGEGSNIDTLLLLLLLLVVLFSHGDSIFLLLRFISFRLPSSSCGFECRFEEAWMFWLWTCLENGKKNYGGFE